MNDRVCEVFTLSGFHKIFSIHPSEQEAAAAFHSSEAV
jgi:anti-anti-sigma regulatory factor